jgi:hypothetical protein
LFFVFAITNSLQQRQQGKLQEVTEQYDKKVKELEMVEKQLKETQR